MNRKKKGYWPIPAGTDFGELTVVRELSGCHYECLCDCGKTIVVRARNLLDDMVQSCGHNNENDVPTPLVHTSTYTSWYQMVYKARKLGGTFAVCNEWLTLENFVRDMGDRPDGYGLDRIDYNKPFSKQNCEWAPLGKIRGKGYKGKGL